MQRSIGCEPVCERAYSQPDEQPGEYGGRVHGHRFPHRDTLPSRAVHQLGQHPPSGLAPQAKRDVERVQAGRRSLDRGTAVTRSGVVEPTSVDYGQGYCGFLARGDGSR